MRKALALLALCTFATAMIPREKKDVQQHNTQGVAICAPTTPCGWTVYKPITYARIPDFNVPNTYCNCDTGMVCTDYEIDQEANSMVRRCTIEST